MGGFELLNEFERNCLFNYDIALGHDFELPKALKSEFEKAK